MSALSPSPESPSPERYETGRGCLTLILITALTLAGLIVLVVLFGNMSA